MRSNSPELSRCCLQRKRKRHRTDDDNISIVSVDSVEFAMKPVSGSICKDPRIHVVLPFLYTCMYSFVHGYCYQGLVKY